VTGPPFAVGDEVDVLSLRRAGRIVEVRNGRYRVAVGSVLVWSPASDLRAVPAAPRPKRRVRSAEAGAPVETAGTRRVDLHGLTADEARDVILAAVDRSVLDGIATLELVHGRGTGRLKAVVQRVLAELPVVRHVRPHPTNPGVTVAHL